MKPPASPGPGEYSGEPTRIAAECLFDDTCILDIEYFVKTLSAIKANGAPPDLIGSIITRYASKWLPDLASDVPQKSSESITESWMKKRFFVERLVGILPPERDSLPCNFLLRLLRIANMVGVESAYREELERRISWQLDQATLREIMIPSFSYSCGTLLDVEVMVRIVKGFVSLEEGGHIGGAAAVKVAKLVDSYLAEAAVDSNLTTSEFVDLAGAIPPHARTIDDALYRAIDTYLKAHPAVSKQETQKLCRLMDSRKLTSEACIHASQNERLPVRAIIRVLLSEQTKLHRQLDWSASFNGTRGSPNLMGLETSAHWHSSRRQITTQQMELNNLKDDVLRLQGQCFSMQGQIERLLGKKKKNKGLFSWKKMGMPSFKTEERQVDSEDGFDINTKLVRGTTPSKWRKSMF